VACALAISGATAQPAPENGGTLIVGISGDPPSLNPDITNGVPDKLIGCMIYESLVRISKKYEAEPLLAKSWEISPDGLSYRFKLVDAKWQDGQPFTSDDVKFTLTEVSPKFGARFIAAANSIKNVETPDRHTVVINLSRPFGPLLMSLSCSTNAAILPAHIFRGQDVTKHEASISAPIGTGPFKLAEWARGDHLTLNRNEAYWATGQPHLDRIIAKIIPEPSARLLALQAGEIDYMNAYYFALSNYKVVAATPHLKLGDTSYPTNDLILINTKRPPLDDPRVRRALFTAIDRDYILKNVFLGIGSIAKSAIDDRIAWAYNPAVDTNKLYAFDPVRARKMLDEAGLKPGADGTRFAISLVFDATRPDWLPWAQVLQQFWQAIGVKTTLESTDRAVVLKRVYTDYDYGATLQAYTTGGDPALGISRLYTTRSIQRGQAFVNGSQYSNPEIDRLFEAGETGATQQDRALAYFRIQEILAQDLPAFNIHQTADREPASINVHGLWEGAEEYSWWGGAWMAKK
jgi:peptide/nickel transport system substrate-binding protein